MLYIDLIIFLLFAYFLFNKKDIFSPWFLTLFVWIGEIVAYLIFGGKLFPLKGHFELAIFVWVVPFVISSLIGSNTCRPKGQMSLTADYNKNIFNILFVICLVLVPILIKETFDYASKYGPSDNLFYNLRYLAINADQEGFDLGPIKYIVGVSLVLLFASANQKKINKLQLASLFVLNLLVGISTMAKTTIFMVLIGVCFILIYNKKMSPKYILLPIGLVLVLTLLFKGLRSYSGKVDEVDVAETLSIYVISPIVAFDYQADRDRDPGMGVNTFRFFNKVLDKAGFDVEVEKSQQEFVRVPVLTNVYTIFYQYYCDFGIAGVLIFAIINGLIYGRVYRLMNYKPYLKPVYAYLVVSLFLQFFNEIFWVLFSMVIQFVIVSFLLYDKTIRLTKKSYIPRSFRLNY